VIALVALASSSVIPSPSASATGSAARSPPNLIRAWGLNEEGELGDGTTQNTAVPVEVTGLRGVKAIAGGSNHSLALLTNGTVMAWGVNGFGQLGDGSTNNSDVPVAVSGLREVVAVAAGEDHSLALLKDGTVMAWGRNTWGQLGDGGSAGSDVPVEVSGLAHVAAISAGGDFSLALLESGAVMAWGENFYGQLGDGSTHNSDVPVAVSGAAGVKRISAGFRHSVALLSDGAVIAWGANEAGQLGDGTESPSDVPVAVDKLSDASAVAAGQSQSLAVGPGGAVVAWGDNEKGQLGDDSHTGPELCGEPRVFPCSKMPVAVRGLTGVVAVSAGSHGLALLADGSVMAWGPNNAGQLGVGSSIGPEACGPTASACSTIPVPSAIETFAAAISAGTEYSLALSSATPGPLPELGRCVRVSNGGAYGGTSGRCMALSKSHNGHFEWLPGPGSNAKFEEHLGETQLESVGGVKLRCRRAVLEGEYTGPKTETITHLTLTGCVDVTSSSTCQTNAIEEGVIESSVPLAGKLGFITPTGRPRLGWEIRPKPPASLIVSFDCGSGASAAVSALEGSIIGRATPLDTMASAFELQYKQRHGKQIPEFLSSGERHVLILSTTPFMREPTQEQVGLSSIGCVTNEEPLEIKAKL
jgi:alpha-tubulin suppressor-like RCC1 family protein